jgi:hypothetical protein
MEGERERERDINTQPLSRNLIFPPEATILFALKKSNGTKASSNNTQLFCFSYGTVYLTLQYSNRGSLLFTI